MVCHKIFKQKWMYVNTKKTNTRTEGGSVTYIVAATPALTISFTQNCGVVKKQLEYITMACEKIPRY